MGKDIGTVILGTTPVYRSDERYGPKPGRLPNPIKIENYTPLPQHDPCELHIEAPEYDVWPIHPGAPEPKHDMSDATPYDINAQTYDGGIIVIQNAPGSYSRNRNE